jgi:xanthine/uracil/vitamin C permease (AzgA family)
LAGEEVVAENGDASGSVGMELQQLDGISSVEVEGTIAWDEPRIAIPAFLTLVTIPLTWSIADGLSFGLTSFAALELLSGRGRRQNWMLYGLAVLFLLRFIYKLR